MIDMSQWRVAIGLWNCCSVLICCSSTQKGGCTLSSCFILSISLIVLVAFLIILSGDVELNPGPPKCTNSVTKDGSKLIDDVDIKAVIKVLRDIIQRNYSCLSDATEGCLRKIAEQLYSKGLVSRAVQISPMFDSVMSEFEATLQISNSIQQIECNCNQFVQSLSSQGGPAQGAVTNLVEQWKHNINRQFDLPLFMSQSCSNPAETETPITQSDEVHSEIPGAVMPTITLPPECETTIGAMLRSLFSKFVDLLGKFTEEIEEKITCGDVTLTRIIRYVQNYTMSEENLQASQNLEDLIRKVDTHYDFLDFELILAMAEQFSSADLLQKLQNHSKAATKFRESQPVEILAKQLKNIYGPYSNVTSGPVAYIDLNSAWNKVNIRGLYILINCFFPNSDRKSLMKHIKITSASVHIEYYMTESSFQKVVADVEEKISFMHLIGIYRFKVNGYVILPGRHENVNFTFESGLLNAAWIGNNQVVQLLLDLGVNVDCTNEQGSTALMLATECGYEPIVQTLLSSGLNVNIQDSYGWTALMLASHNGHFQLAELLLNKQANVNHTANNGATALMIASQNGHFQVAGLLLNKQANVNLKEADGWTALMLASQNGHFQIAELLLNKQANVNHTANNGATALMNASQNGYVQVTELLLNKQANVNHTANNGATALMLASKNGHFQVTDLLLNKQANVNHTANNGWTALMLASHNGNFEVMELLLNKQANVNNHIANNGATALMLASQNGHFQAVELLLNKAANVNHTAKNGSTALMLASQNGHIQVTELLLNKQATVNHTANNGWTALMLASQNGHFQVTELLLNKQADINVTNNNGWTALMLASQNGHFQIVELLLDANASPIVTDSYGTEISSLLVAVYNNSPDTVDVLLWTFEFPTDHIMRAFVLACYCGHSTLINTLITDLPQTKLLIPCVKGDLAAVTSIIELNPDTPLVYGLTPLMIATSCEHIELIDALIQAGADVNTCNDYGNNALDIAEGTFNKQQDVIQLLLVNGAVHNIPTDTVIDELTQNIPPHQLQHQSIEETDSSSTTLEKIQSFIKSFLTPIMK